jgi:hypothetical protein
LNRHRITPEYVRELLDYDPETGELTWRETKSGRTSKIAGTVQPCHNGYRRKVVIDYGMYMAHRVIWLWMTGKWPRGDIDHKDRNGLNNRWTNLHVVTKAENNKNRVKKFNWTKKPPGRKPWVNV